MIGKSDDPRILESVIRVLWSCLSRHKNMREIEEHSLITIRENYLVPRQVSGGTRDR